MFLNDLKYAWRRLRSSPVFTIAAVVTIALGIGATTAIFSVTNAVLLRSLNYRDSNRLVVAIGEMRKRNVTDWPFSNADFFDLRNGTRPAFEDMAAVATGRGILPRADGSLEQVRFAQVTPDFFRLMGAHIAIGRDFNKEDGQPQPLVPTVATPAATPQHLPTIAILSYEYWQRRYGGSRDILGHTLTPGRAGAIQIVGVLAPRFELLLPPHLNQELNPDVWTAGRLTYDNANRNTVGLWPIGRLREGATLDRAQSEADAVAAEIRKDFSIHRTSGFNIRLEPMRRYLVAAVRPVILALMGGVIFLLLIACANVANLLLVRASLRERELAVRTALGGSGWRFVRQMLAEALLLSGLGMLLGLGLASAGIGELRAIAPANLPRLEWIRIDPAVLLFTALISVAAAILFGLPPALRASRRDVLQALRGTGRTEGLGGGGLLRSMVVIVEVALAFVLLIGSGLMFRSFLKLQQIDTGYDPRGLLTFQVLGNAGDQPQQRAAFSRQIEDRLRALPGVLNLTASFPFPLAGGFSPIRWGTGEALADSSKFQAVDVQIVLPGYFETLRTPILTGRTFTDADSTSARKVVVVDQLLAAKAFPNQTAVGKRILIRIRTPEPEWVEIIGVVAHQRDESLTEPGRAQVYFTDGFLGNGAARNWAIRTAADPVRYGPAVASSLARVSRQLVITDVQPMTALVEKAQAGTRFSLLLIGLFAAIAAVLAGVGLYGVLSTVVRQRTAEIGVRMTLGAVPARIFGSVVGNGIRLSAIGLVAGFIAALGLTRLMQSMLVGVKSTDPATFAVMALLFLGIAGLASWIPALRASYLDPSTALRRE
ncbi:MAG: ABC transporter permease [Acidobacteriaceae bacterium]|nr:ABC transporter permease [Acidobacteriaceae bacterium]